VSKATPLAALSSSANPSILGASTTLTATVSGSNPTGTVTFKDGSTTLGTGTLSGGTATLGISTLGVGSHNLTAVYAGDTNYLTSTSAGLSQVVNSALVASTTTLSTSATPAALGSAVSFSASVTGGSSPTGSVTFMDGSNTLGTGSLSNGVATLAVSSLTAGGHSITAVYAGDSLNGPSTSPALMQTITATPAMVYQYGYDAMGRPTIMVDPNGQTTNIYYDSLGRPIQKQEPANVGASTPTITQMGYNLADDLTSVTDPRNLATTYSPNGLGNVTAQTSPDSGTSGYTYDANGNLLTKTDARGKLTSYTYDVLDRLKTVTYPSGTPTALEYDGGAAPYAGATGELTKITDESGSITYSYDSAGRLTSKTQITNSGGGGKTLVVGYTWGDSGSAIDKLIAITYPSGNRVNYSYDQYGQVSGISTNAANPNGVGTNTGAANPLLSGITTNADGQPTGWSWANGKTQAIGYDSFGLVASYKLGDATGTGASAGVLRTLSRDAAGRILGYSHTNSATPVSNLDQSFGYDNLNRLLSASQGSASTQYSYDATGNRTSTTVNATTYANTVSPSSNRLTQTQDVGGTASIVHDAAGNITSDGLNSFTYSDRGRMASATTAGGTVNYRYNALELRVSKTGPTSLIPTGTSYYVYDEAGKLLGEYDANGAPLYETVYLGGSIAALPVGVIKQTGSAANGNIATDLYHVYADHTATPRVITRATDEAIVWRWDASEAFGGTTPDQNPNALGTFAYNQRFPGQVFDAETGLFDNWNRTYDARQGRYRQSDPIGLGGGINTYSYVSGNPLDSIDPMGLWEVADIFPDGAPIVAIGRAIGGVVAYGQGVIAGNRALADAAMEGLQCARADNMDSLVLMLSMGRGGRQPRLRDLANDPLLGAADRGWLTQEINAINRGQRSSIRNPPGKDLAHERGREAAKGYDYKQANLQDRDLHKLQHKYDDYGRANLERPLNGGGVWVSNGSNRCGCP
jgi:RHS repeat-associated protein